MRFLIDDRKILEFDETAARRSKRDTAMALREGSQSKLLAVLDASSPVIELRMNRYKLNIVFARIGCERYCSNEFQGYQFVSVQRT